METVVCPCCSLLYRRAAGFEKEVKRGKSGGGVSACGKGQVGLGKQRVGQRQHRAARLPLVVDLEVRGEVGQRELERSRLLGTGWMYRQ